MLLEVKNINHFKLFSNNQIVSNILNQNRKLKTLILQNSILRTINLLIQI